MRKLIFAGTLLIILAGIAVTLWFSDYTKRSQDLPSILTPQNAQNTDDSPRLTVVAEDLDVPWSIAILPDDSLLVTERAGRVLQINPLNGEKKIIATLPDVREIGEGGLQGITLHPDFETNSYIYLYYTYAGTQNNTQNRVSRFTFSNNSLTDETIIVNAIPGASNHDGGFVGFGPDDFLYIATGDAQEPSLAQNTQSLAGKILRVTDTGDPAPNNPFNNRIFSYGHRNPQGICWDDRDQMYSTEHGPSGAGSGFDELNLIRPKINYGWPTIQGDESQTGMQTALIQSGSSDTWAPAAAACVESSVYFGGLRGNALYEAQIQGDAATLVTHLDGEVGRVRAVTKTEDGFLYISTSNRDGRGVPSANDDRILRVNISKL
jgi:glucose/arabinose dehydrogenase